MTSTKIFRSPLADVELTDQDLLSHVFYSACNINPDTATFIDASSGESRSRSEVISSTKRLMFGLRELGVQEHSVVAFCSPNTVDYAAICFAIIGLGATVAPLAPSLTQEELQMQLGITEAKFFIVHSTLIETAHLATKNLSLSWILQSDADFLADTPTAESLMNLMAKADIVQIPQEELESRIAIISFTSGVVGPAKAVRISHKNITSNMLQWEAAQGSCRETNGVWIGFVGFSGLHGLMAFICTPLRTGITVVVMAGFDRNLYLDCVQKHRPVQLHVGPPVVRALVSDPRIASYDLSSVQRILCGGSPLDLDTVLAVQNLFKNNWGTSVVCHQVLGLSETSPVATFTPLERPTDRAGIGYILPNMEFRFIDAFTLEDAAINECGTTEPAEICCRGPNVAQSYMEAEATQNSFYADEVGGKWLRTGDVGTIDSEGWIHLKDRTNDIFNHEGIMVIPSELEVRLQQHPLITQSCVVATCDPKTGKKVPMAFVVLKPGSQNYGGSNASEVILDWFDKQSLQHEKLRGGIHIVDSIPQTMVGKLVRRMMKETIREL